MRNIAMAGCIALAGCGAGMKDQAQVTASLPDHIESINSEVGRKCFVIDEATEGVSNFIRTICENGNIPMSNEGQFSGEVCGVLEFPKHPKYQFLFPGDEDARECLSDSYPSDI